MVFANGKFPKGGVLVPKAPPGGPTGSPQPVPALVAATLIGLLTLVGVTGCGSGGHSVPNLPNLSGMVTKRENTHGQTWLTVNNTRFEILAAAYPQCQFASYYPNCTLVGAPAPAPVVTPAPGGGGVATVKPGAPPVKVVPPKAPAPKAPAAPKPAPKAPAPAKPPAAHK